MIPVEIKIPLKGDKFKTLHRQVPAKWNELTGRQLVQVIAAHLTISDRHLYRLSLIKILFQIKSRHLILVPADFLLGCYRAIEFIDIKKNLTAQLLPSIKLPGFRVLTRRLYGPRESFRNLLFLEFIFADTFFIRYLKNQDEKTLDKFIACLYREKTWFHFIKKNLVSYTGDARVSFNQHLIDGRARKLENLPFEYKLAILAWYRGCREELERDYPKVFSEDNQDAASKGGWDNVLRAMAGNIYNLEITGRVHVRQILAAMEDRAKEVERAEKQK